MIFRILKWFALVVGGLILMLVVGILAFFTWLHFDFERFNITDALVRDGRYDPAEHYKFDRACTSYAGDSGFFDLLERGYTHVDLAYVDEPTAVWPLVLIDDSQKTFQILYGREFVVKAPGTVCNPKITLRTETVNGRLRAYVEEARGR
jgi:hypothetical protein